MNKYYVFIGETILKRWGQAYLVQTNLSIDELENNEKFLSIVDDILCDMYYEYADEDEDFEDFIAEGGILCETRPYTENDSDLEIIRID